MRTILYFNVTNPSILKHDVGYNKITITDKYHFKHLDKIDIKKINTFDIFHRNYFKKNEKKNISFEKLRKYDLFFFEFSDQYLRWHFGNKISQLELRAIYHNSIMNWIFFIEQYNIKKIYYDNAPHRAFDYVLYKIAENLNLKNIIFEKTNVEYRIFAKKKIRPNIENLEKIKPLNQLSNININLQHIHEFKKLNIFKIIFKEILLLSKLLAKILINYKSENYIIPKNKFNFLNNWKYFLFIYQSKFNKLFYRIIYDLNITKYPRIQKKDIIFYKHYQPEATTNPLSLPIFDQTFCLERFFEIKDISIFVKEHPSSLSFDNSHMNKFPNKISDIFFYKNNKIKLIKNFDDQEHVCATLSGTAGLENALKGRKVVCFSKPWYYFLPNVHVYNTENELTNFIKLNVSYDTDKIEDMLLNFFNNYTESFTPYNEGKNDLKNTENYLYQYDRTTEKI